MHVKVWGECLSSHEARASGAVVGRKQHERGLWGPGALFQPKVALGK